MQESFLKELAAAARDSAKAGGDQLLAYRDKFGVKQKAEFDYVTDADLASQKAIEACLRERFPDHAFFGEESANHDPPPPEAICWVADPLDGTTNYVHQFPCYTVSIAVVQHGQVLAATVFDPLLQQHYWAYRGGGAWLDDQRITVSQTEGIAHALISMSLPPHVNRDSPDLQDFIRVVQKCQAIRRTGSAAMNLAHLAAGRIDAYWARQIHPWDVAAGVLLIQEAGGVVTSSTGGPFDLWKADLAAAASPGVHQELLGELSQAAS